MAKKDKKPAPAKKSEPESHIKPVSENRKARFEYEILDSLECGIALMGSEVKTLRNGRVSLDEAYARLREGEVWLLGCDIPEYTPATIFNHTPKRPRKLLMHRREIRKFAAKAGETGLTLVPLRLYFKDGRAKVLLGLCKGKQMHDKRETLKKNEAKRDMARAMKTRRR